MGSLEACNNHIWLDSLSGIVCMYILNLILSVQGHQSVYVNLGYNADVKDKSVTTEVRFYTNCVWVCAWQSWQWYCSYACVLWGLSTSRVYNNKSAQLLYGFTTFVSAVWQVTSSECLLHALLLAVHAHAPLESCFNCCWQYSSQEEPWRFWVHHHTLKTDGLL